MPQVFPRHANLIARGFLLLVPVLGVAGVATWIGIRDSSWETEVEVPLSQPVPFSHEHHVSGLGLDCRFCHASAAKTAAAGLPPTQTCMGCHSQIWADAPMLAPVRESLAKNVPIRWERVHRLPKYVYFDHSIHVNQGVGCTSCHGEIGKMPITWKTKPFRMKDCLDCHREPERALRPRDQVFDPAWTPPPNQRELGAKLAREYRIPKYRLTDCVTCHR